MIKLTRSITTMMMILLLSTITYGDYIANNSRVNNRINVIIKALLYE